MKEKNQLIAMFLGWELSEKGRKLTSEDYYPYGYVKAHPDYLYFHFSWDWLMPVIKKCKRSEGAPLWSNIAQSLLTLDIEKTHQSVVEFIEWYNKKNDSFIPDLEYRDGFGNWYPYDENLQKNKYFVPFKTRKKNET